jgi:UDP-N-acetylmuramoyl-tripeptide--D-alanyl-D-alanine ligase
VQPGLRGRRIAVLGDMLELGADGPALHRDLAPAIEANAVDVVFGAGPLMENLMEALPHQLCGAYAGTAAELEQAVLEAVRGGDVVMIKGSNGIRTGRIVKALKDRYGHGATAAASNG